MIDLSTVTGEAYLAALDINAEERYEAEMAELRAKDIARQAALAVQEPAPTFTGETPVPGLAGFNIFSNNPLGEVTTFIPPSSTPLEQLSGLGGLGGALSQGWQGESGWESEGVIAANIQGPQAIIPLGVGIGAFAGKINGGENMVTTALTTVKPGDSPSSGNGGGITGALPTSLVGAGSSLAGILSALGVSAPVIATLGAGLGVAYGALEAVGVQFPWETGAGEGFIAPWTPKTKDENGKWVSATTRPDLVGGGNLGAIDGVKVVKTWKAGGWPFSLTSDGRIHTITKNGIQKSWKPKKPIVLMRGTTNLGTAIKAQRYLDHMWRTVAKRTRQLKLAH